MEFPWLYFGHFVWCLTFTVFISKTIGYALLLSVIVACLVHKRAHGSSPCSTYSFSPENVLKVVNYLVFTFLHLCACGFLSLQTGQSIQTFATLGTYVLLGYKVTLLYYLYTLSNSKRQIEHNSWYFLWSSALSFPGLVFRTHKHAIAMAIASQIIFGHRIEFTLFDLGLHSVTWRCSALVLLGSCLVVLCVFSKSDAIVYLPGRLQSHFSHKLLHEVPILYIFIHKIHHCARKPIFSDSGTISPLEFAWSEVNWLGSIIHPFLWLAYEIKAIGGHCDAHDWYGVFGKYDHHILHHSKNTGNYTIPYWDKITGDMIKSWGACVARVTPHSKDGVVLASEKLSLF